MSENTNTTGSAYIGVVGSELEIGECRDSIMKMTMRPGDYITTIRATKGYEARQSHVNRFLDSGHEWLFLMDADQIFPEDALEKLRNSGKKYISGAYMRRRYQPILPVWFENAEAGQPDLRYWTAPINDEIYEIGASGWGCMLMHRDVILGVRAILKGEPEIAEDDMDLYPYDLGQIFLAINQLDRLAANYDVPGYSVAKYVKMLRNELRPLRVHKDIVGSDVRFPFFAKLAGFQLYGHGGVKCGHMVNYPLSPEDYSALREMQGLEIDKALDEAISRERGRIASALEALR